MTTAEPELSKAEESEESEESDQPSAAAESDVQGAGGTTHPPKRSEFAWRERRWVVAAAVAAAGLVLFVAYLAQARTLPVHLDAPSGSAWQTLQAWDMLHGNVLLRGWSLADVSVYTTELPEYMLVELIRGLNGDVVHVAAALSYTLIVVLGALLAKGRATGREGLIRLLVAAAIMLAPSLRPGTDVLLSGPDHTGTQVPLLVIWLVLDRARARWWVPVVVTVLLTWAQVGDAIVLVECVLPLVVVCAVRMYRQPRPLAQRWYELSLAGGALISAGVAKLALAVIKQAGGFTLRPPVIGFSTAASMSAQFWVKVQRVLDVFGASFFGLRLGHSSAIVLALHLIGFALVVWAVAVGVRRFLGESDLIVQVLVAAFVLLLAAYIFGTKPDANEMVGLLPIGAVLAGRLLPGRLSRARLVPTMGVVLACNCLLLAFHALQPAAPDQSVPSANWFDAHHLAYGLGQVADANKITVDSGDRVQVRPTRFYNHQLVTTSWQTNASWYDANQHDASFVVWKVPSSCANACEPVTDLRNEFGPPATTYQVGDFIVLVWHKNLLANVPMLYWCGDVWPWNASGPPSAKACS